MYPQTLKERASAYFASRPEVEVAYLFGSQASGRENRLSDIDLAVLVDEATLSRRYPYGYEANVLTDLFKLFGTTKIDLVLLNEAPLLLKHRVVCHGQPIFIRDESSRIRLQVGAVGQYLDLKPLLRIHLQPSGGKRRHGRRRNRP